MNQKADVLAALLIDTPADPRPEEADLFRIVHRRTGKNGIPVGGTVPRGIRKKKATYYLSEKVLVELCEAKARIKVLVPPEMKSKVSMSRIVDYAVGAILAEFHTIGDASDLMNQFLTDKTSER